MTHAPFTLDQIDSIKDDQIITTRNDGCRRYLLRWKGRPESDDAWITREEYGSFFSILDSVTVNDLFF